MASRASAGPHAPCPAAAAGVLPLEAVHDLPCLLWGAQAWRVHPGWAAGMGPARDRSAPTTVPGC